MLLPPLTSQSVLLSRCPPAMFALAQKKVVTQSLCTLVIIRCAPRRPSSPSRGAIERELAFRKAALAGLRMDRSAAGSCCRLGFLLPNIPRSREVSMEAYRSPAVDLIGSPARNDLRPPPRPQCFQVNPAADSRQRSHGAIDLIGSPARNDLRPPPRSQCFQVNPQKSTAPQAPWES